MSLIGILDIIKNYSSPTLIFLIVIISIVQLTPIKINPWSKLFSFIGRSLNKDLMKEITNLKDNTSQLDEKLKNLEKRVNENYIVECRARIIKFGDEISHGIKHSRDGYQMILYDITIYEKYCSSHPEFKNNMIRITSERIEEEYKKRDRSGSLL